MRRYPAPVSDETLEELHAWFAPDTPFAEWADTYRRDLDVEFIEAWA